MTIHGVVRFFLTTKNFPMINQSTIDLVRSRADIREVVGAKLNLKRVGSGYTACCPFHEEKSPSFHVSPAKGMYKCFGCGKGGDAISFVMEHDRLPFNEAIERLAETLNIPIEYDKKEEATPEKKERKAEMAAVLRYANEKYMAALAQAPLSGPAAQYLSQRGISLEVAQQWDLGWAPNDFKFLTTQLINIGRYQPANDCGLITTKEGKSWDFLVNRITIPVRDHNGNIITIAGRALPEEGNEKSIAKYLNGRESELYHKSRAWYGLYEAVRARAIQQAEVAYIVEGYFDVISMHEAGVQNTIAACGTAITEDHIQFLKRYTRHVCLMQDADKAGVASMLKAIDMFLAADFKIEVVELPNKQDPDEYIRQLIGQTKLMKAA